MKRIDIYPVEVLRYFEANRTAESNAFWFDILIIMSGRR